MREDELKSRLLRSNVDEPMGELPIGTQMGDWKLTAFVAKGGSADVYCAEHITLGTSAAVKVLRDAGKDSRRERFRREAKILSELKSLSFPRFYAYGTSCGHDYLIEELLEERELPKGNCAANRFLLALCTAVGELHARGLVHCDIKPSNILFRASSGEPVLVDLGLAMSAAEDSGGGTPGYSAPEQFLGGEITPAADIHALGVLAERLGVNGRTIIRRATSSIPSERFKTVGEFALALRRRLWGVRIGWATLITLVSAILFGSIVAILGSRVPAEIVLKGQKHILLSPLVIPPGKTVRVIGPGTLDAEILGEKNACLWMTNCIVINRAQKIYPEVPLFYELANGVYLNFINADKPMGPWHMRDYFNLYDGAFNEVRHRGPETISGLMQLRNTEYYQMMREN